MVIAGLDIRSKVFKVQSPFTSIARTTMTMRAFSHLRCFYAKIIDLRSQVFKVQPPFRTCVRNFCAHFVCMLKFLYYYYTWCIVFNSFIKVENAMTPLDFRKRFFFVYLFFFQVHSPIRKVPGARGLRAFSLIIRACCHANSKFSL